jgi:flavodoxin
MTATAADPVRRALMTALGTLPIGGAAAASDNDAEPRRARSKTLVACFSRSGNTRVMAGLIHRALHTEVFEIRPAMPYPEDYLTTVEEARQERDSGRVRALAATAASMSAYDTVFLGYPVWGETVPPVERAFLASHDWSGKTVIPFVTHGGYGLGNSASVLARDVPKARLQQGFAMQADQERRTMNQVNDWLAKVRIDRSMAPLPARRP